MNLNCLMKWADQSQKVQQMQDSAPGTEEFYAPMYTEANCLESNFTGKDLRDLVGVSKLNLS